MSEKILKVEDASYWEKRAKDDTRLDWRNEAGSWLDEYVASVNHPHRQLIVDTLEEHQPDGIVEVGCNTGPNLVRLHQAFPETELAGVDINSAAIERAQKLLPKAILKVANGVLPFPDKSFDWVIADATLMYFEDVTFVIHEMKRVARKGIIIIDWFDESKKGTLKDHHWARNYPALFPEFTCETTSFTGKTWPSKTWQSNGRMFVFLRG